VRWLLDKFRRLSHEHYNCEVVVTVDEIMVVYKGHFCNIRQFVRSKPTRFGIKVWILASSQSRYVYNMVVYLGADNEDDEDCRDRGPNNMGGADDSPGMAADAVKTCL
jgi:hypothetical protein